MEKGEDMSAYKARLIVSHIVKCMTSYKGEKPMIVGMQGPQGSGKTTTTNKVKELLEAMGSKVAVFSLDDLYKTHDDMKRLAEENKDNPLLQGRGQPGTHDMELGTTILQQIKNSPTGTKIDLPIYDKSKYNGEGDRSNSIVSVMMPLDIVIFEGWCMGFHPISQMDIQRIYHVQKGRSEENTWSDVEEKDLYLRSHHLKNLFQINTLLEAYLEWYRHIYAFVQLKPDRLENVFAWRLQAEHAMKAAGKEGMTDEQVHDFVARYMPGYELFGDGVTQKGTPWNGNGLQIIIDAQRHVLEVAYF